MEKRKKTISEIMRRYLVFSMGLLLIAIGTAIMIRADIGVTPIVILPYTASLISPEISVGVWVFIFNILAIMVNMLIRRDTIHKWEVLFHFLLALILGIFTDLSLEAFSDFIPVEYLHRVMTCMGGILVFAGGLYFCRIADVGTFPVYALTKKLSGLFHRRYIQIKLVLDVLFCAFSVILGLLCIDSLGGFREGTVVAAFFMGALIKILIKPLRRFNYLLLPENRVREISSVLDDDISENHFVLTVSHEYGSGGRTIARRIAHELDISYYDSDEIQISGFEIPSGEEPVSTQTDSVGNSIYDLYEWYKDSFNEENELTSDQMCKMEAQVIQEIASKDSCVIVGRLANYVLKNHKNSLHIFITADEDERIKRVMRKENIDSESALERIEQYSQERKHHCYQFSDMQWGRGDNYDIIIKSSKYGVDRTAAILLELIREFRLIQF
ncbi:MAG: cytidylate kinase family protein [Anaerovibrio sp.]|uniref:cytidylate kinase family protein n=1 Tax=Anaerovibrio sp. TaxID=1872532 RepID=UPI0025FFC8B3|nr:cytidylate kinase family protein [Anaerovibrio sp.]MCR5175976.1 cytidylate kinase family protein [Anaerovibrio sp.]